MEVGGDQRALLDLLHRAGLEREVVHLPVRVLVALQAPLVHLQLVQAALRSRFSVSTTS